MTFWLTKQIYTVFVNACKKIHLIIWFDNNTVWLFLYFAREGNTFLYIGSEEEIDFATNVIIFTHTVVRSVGPQTMRKYSQCQRNTKGLKGFIYLHIFPLAIRLSLICTHEKIHTHLYTQAKRDFDRHLLQQG